MLNKPGQRGFRFTSIKPGEYVSAAYAGYHRVPNKYVIRKESKMWAIYIDDVYYGKTELLKDAKNVCEQHWYALRFLSA